MRFLFGGLFVLIVVKNAYAAPDGCFVTFDNPSSCYSQMVPQECYSDDFSNLYHYGNALGAICNAMNANGLKANANYSGWLQCTDSLNFATSEALSVNQSLITANALIKKLKRACGFRCARIR